MGALGLRNPETTHNSEFHYEIVTIYDDEHGDIEVRRTLSRDVEPKRLLLMAPGCSTDVHIQDESARLLAGQGNEVWTFDNRTDNGGDASATKLEALQAVFDNAGGMSEDPVAVLAHSQGGLVAAEMYRSMVEAGRQDELGPLILIASAGITEPVSKSELAKNSALEVVTHIRDTNFMRGMGKNALGAVLNNARYALVNNVHLLDEVNSIAKSDIRDDIAFLREAGIPVGIVACSRDKIFPITDMHITGLRMENEHGVIYDQLPTTHARFIASEENAETVAGMLDMLQSNAPQRRAS